MTDRELAIALREHVPGAIEALYDTYGAGLYMYCWFTLRSRESAQAALRDAMVLAEAHIARLADPGSLRPWLYALARAECRRHPAAPGSEADEPAARPDQHDAALRLMAWHAVMSLSPAEREVLDLATRHGMGPGDASLVTGRPPEEMQELLATATGHLEQAVAAVILVSRASHECAGRTEAMRGWAGTLTAPLRERIVRHAASCRTCVSSLPRTVSAARVFSMLPRPSHGSAVRTGVLGCFSDPGLATYRAFTAGRFTAFDGAGFPAATGPLTPPVARSRRGSRLAAGLTAAAAAVAIAAAFVFGGLGGAGGSGTAMRGALPDMASALPQAAPVTGTQQSRLRPVLRPTIGSDTSVVPVAAARPADAGNAPAIYDGWGRRWRATPGAPVAQPGTPQPTGQGSQVPAPSPDPSTQVPPGRLQVSPARLSLGTGSQGRIVLRAEGGTVDWTASASSPDVTLSSTSGTLGAGQSTTLTVAVSRQDGAGGHAVISISPGARARVSWTASPSSSPAPPGSPSPPPSGSPSPPASPSMSTSAPASQPASPSPSASGTSSPPPPASPPPPGGSPGGSASARGAA